MEEVIGDQRDRAHHPHGDGLSSQPSPWKWLPAARQRCLVKSPVVSSVNRLVDVLVAMVISTAGVDATEFNPEQQTAGTKEKRTEISKLFGRVAWFLPKKNKRSFVFSFASRLPLEVGGQRFCVLDPFLYSYLALDQGSPGQKSQDERISIRRTGPIAREQQVGILYKSKIVILDLSLMINASSVFLFSCVLHLPQSHSSSFRKRS